jgi:endonuclease/exonuclease/phosphatase family metal-dependent hydrolase
MGRRRLWVLPTVAALALVAGGAAYLVSPSGGDGSAPSSAAAAPGEAVAVDDTQVDDPEPAATVTAPPVTETVTPEPRVVVKWREKRVPVPGPTVRVPVPGPTVTLPPRVVRVRVPVPGPTVTLPPRVVMVPEDPQEVLPPPAQEPPPPPAAQEPQQEPEPADPGPEAQPEPTADPQTGTDEPTDDQPAEPAPEPTPEQPEPTPAVFRAASYNVLGHSHTEPGGTRPAWGSGTTRIRWALYLLRLHRVDVVGLQELQDPQHAAFLRRPGWRVWPRRGHTDNAVAWRHGVFRLVDATRTPIPYFRGQEVRMPVVLLEHRATGQRTWVGSFHNPASLPWLGSQREHREEALDRQATLATRLDNTHPVLITGDMNDGRDYYCPFVRATGYVAANGGTVRAGACQPPAPTPIDWIFGSPGTSFTGYRSVHGPLAARTSDHPLIVTNARIGGLTR